MGKLCGSRDHTAPRIYIENNSRNTWASIQFFQELPKELGAVREVSRIFSDCPHNIHYYRKLHIFFPFSLFVDFG